MWLAREPSADAILREQAWACIFVLYANACVTDLSSTDVEYVMRRYAARLNGSTLVRAIKFIAHCLLRIDEADLAAWRLLSLCVSDPHMERTAHRAALESDAFLGSVA